MRRAVDGNRRRTDGSGISQAADDIRRPSRGTEADDDVVGGQIFGYQVLTAQFRRVFRPFFGTENGFITAGDEALDAFRVGAVCRRTFDGIEDAQAAGRTGAHVEQAAAVAQPVGDGVDGLGDVRDDGADGIGDFMVFVIYDAQHVFRRHPVDMLAVAVSLFRRQCF